MASIASREIHTSRLLLRLVAESDLSSLLEIHSEEEVVRYLPFATWRGMPDASAWYERVVSRYNDGVANQFAIVEQSKNAVIGSCMLFGLEAGSGRAEIGYLLGSRHWGCGYMREALAALVTFVFSELALRRLDAGADARNIRSHRLLLSLGFVHEGSLRQRRIVKGEVIDDNLYGLLRHEWPVL